MKKATQTAAVVEARPSLVAKFAGKYSVDAGKLVDTLKLTAFRQSSTQVTNEQLMALLVVADQYGLNPFTKEIYAFPDKGGVVPVVSVDGWIRIINEHPQFESLELFYADDDSEDPWIECVIGRKDRTAPTRIREYLSECRRDTAPWKSHPRRMLRHKVIIQCARVAFGFAGIYDPDEAARFAGAIDVTPDHFAGKPETRAPQAKEVAPVEYTEIPVGEIRETLRVCEVEEEAFLAEFRIERIEDLPLNAVADAFQWIGG